VRRDCHTLPVSPFSLLAVQFSLLAESRLTPPPSPELHPPMYVRIALGSTILSPFWVYFGRFFFLGSFVREFLLGPVFQFFFARLFLGFLFPPATAPLLFPPPSDHPTLPLLFLVAEAAFFILTDCQVTLFSPCLTFPLNQITASREDNRFCCCCEARLSPLLYPAASVFVLPVPQRFFVDPQFTAFQFMPPFLNAVAFFFPPFRHGSSLFPR